ncbi:XisI protein [Rivularia sp. IAM M-261]|nr:XisI protein [Calothrix sp. PCC 7716]GJD17873.1 XisI protein [Rivularia sp. IAM M-261]
MDKLVEYRTLIKSILTHYDQLASTPVTPGVETLLSFDEERDQYLWFQVGWTPKERVRGITIHVRIKNNKIWVEEDWTDEGIANALIEAGVPQTDIVLAFHPPELRANTNFAVA